MKLSYFSIKTYIVGIDTEAVLLGIHNIYFQGELQKIIPQFSLILLLNKSSFNCGSQNILSWESRHIHRVWFSITFELCHIGFVLWGWGLKWEGIKGT